MLRFNGYKEDWMIMYATRNIVYVHWSIHMQKKESAIGDIDFANSNTQGAANRGL